MLTKKVCSLLLVLVIMITGFLPQAVGAEEMIEDYSISSTDDAALPEAAAAAATLQNYPMPSIYTASSVFSLKVNGSSVPVISYVKDYDYAQFSFSGAISLEVTASENITSYSISPMAKNVKGTVNGKKLTFTLTSSTYVIIKINNLKKIVIAADPLETDIPASSGPGIYNVTSSPYNADSTGMAMATTAIQKAINDAHNAGGGTVFIPAGVYKCANLTLKSNVTFYLAGGAVIVGTGKGEDYQNDFRKDSRNADGTYFIRTTVGSSNITMRGRGTIDGKGIEMRERPMPSPPATHKQGEGFLNNLVVPIATSNFTFDGLILRDAGFWMFMVVRSDNVKITNYKGFQDLYKIENDAIDINESQNVLVKHAIAISDDDTFSTKTWPQKGMSKDWPGAIEHLENVVFDDCLAWTRCVAFKIGMGICTPQTGVTIRNSYVFQSARALLVDHGYTQNTLPEEGWARRITFENIDIERVGINQFGNYWFGVSTSTSGDVSDVLFKNINVRETGSQKSRLSGNVAKGGMIDGVTFTDIYVGGKLATTLDDLNVTVVNDNVQDVVIANSKPPLFSDNFEDGNYTGWTVSGGSWSVVADDTKALSQSATAVALITAGSLWTDYAYEAKVQVPIVNANAGIVFRVKDANNYYMYRINAAAQTLELYKCVNGTLTSVSSTAFTSAAKQWYTLKAVVEGNTIKGYADGELKTEWTNPVTELTAGKIGFRTTSAGALFDDAAVTEPSANPVFNTTLFSDNFEDGNSTGWTAASGTWSVVSDSTKALTQKASAVALITAGSSWTDYAYEAKVKVPIANANAGIVFRVKDANNYYMYRVNATAQTLELYKCVNGTLTSVSSTAFTAVPKQWYTLRAVVQGSNIKAYVDGALKIEWTNPATELTAGKIGFRTTSADVLYDHVVVKGS
ncbi:family 16 glycoside hydrolase [Paenibacillus sp. YN15]|uniref:family 16 glycoside hydrolase n=1 Tax=Paenibacillus sp. YN15 TaxID=1742774 RepID=UPI000DCC4ADC|nr:family 16 glycoside hydrolase [Paenibacillus sp. YN15]RAU91457.1 glycoside hydrolase [Paenibacillus sp. YN15]